MEMVSKITSQQVQAMVANALETATERGLFFIHNVVGALMESIPYEPDIAFIVRQNPIVVAAEVKHCIKPVNFIVSFRDQRDKSTGERDRTLHITFPCITGLPFHVEGQGKTTSTNLLVVVRLHGTISTSTKARHMDTTAQISKLLGTLYRRLKLQLDNQVYTSLQRLTTDLASTLMHHRQELDTIVNLSNIEVRCYLQERRQTLAQAFAQSLKPLGSVNKDEPQENPLRSELPDRRDIDTKPEVAESFRSTLEEGKSIEPQLTESASRESNLTALAPTELEPTGLRSEEPRKTAIGFPSSVSSEPCSSQWDNSEPQYSERREKRDRVFLALGSNIGNRLNNIEQACREMDAEPDIRVARTSALYETEPMYVTDQGRFLNGACEVGEPHLEIP